MTQSYAFLDDTVLADLAFEAKADTPHELFEAAAAAVFESMADLKEVRPRIRKTIRLRNPNLDQLMFDWLAELIYLKDAERILFSRFSVRLNHGPSDAPPPAVAAGPAAGESAPSASAPPASPATPPPPPAAPGRNSPPAPDRWWLTATVEGDTVNPKRHDLRADVKAVTYHQFEVGPDGAGGWKARVVLDI